jgi:hypothetical protein
MNLDSAGMNARATIAHDSRVGLSCYSEAYAELAPISEVFLAGDPQLEPCKAADRQVGDVPGVEAWREVLLC